MGGEMRRVLIALLAALALSGCSTTPERDRNIAIGAGVGAGVGALIGSAAGGPPAAWAGAAIGAVSGGIVGSLVRREACYYRNKRGELWQVPCEDPRVRAQACFVSGASGTLEEVDCRRRYRM